MHCNPENTLSAPKLIGREDRPTTNTRTTRWHNSDQRIELMDMEVLSSESTSRNSASLLLSEPNTAAA